jgi:thiol-disulfide isomerase/thioredoxin
MTRVTIPAEIKTRAAGSRLERPEDTGPSPEAVPEPPVRRGPRYWLAISASLVLLVILAAYAAQLASQVDEATGAFQAIAVPGGPAGPFGAGTRAPDFELLTLDGQPVRLSDFAGRPVWINVWASWCAPCRAEMPDINAVYHEIQARDVRAGVTDGLVLLAVSVGEEPADVRRYLATTSYDLPVVVDPTFSITQQYRVTGLPTHYFIGRDGTIRDIAIGVLKPNAIRARLARIL